MMTIINIAVIVLTVVANYMLFKKANTEGWKAIIPIYNDYTCCKIANCIKLFYIKLILTIVGAMLIVIPYIAVFATVLMELEMGGELNDFPTSVIVYMLLIIVGVFVLLAAIIVTVFTNIKYVKMFSEQTVFAVFAGIGAFFGISNTVVLCILAFNDKYSYIDNTADDSAKI